MISNRKWAFMIGALMVAGIGLNGCEDEIDWKTCNSVYCQESGSGEVDNSKI